MPSTKNTLYLPRPLVNKILAHAQKNPEIEVCGLIGSLRAFVRALLGLLREEAVGRTGFEQMQPRRKDLRR